MAEFLAHHLENEYMIENLHMDQWVLYVNDQDKAQRKTCDGWSLSHGTEHWKQKTLNYGHEYRQYWNCNSDDCNSSSDM